MMKNITLIGPFPLPYGGVSIHLTRLVDVLKNRYNIKCIDESRTIKEGVYNIRAWNLYKYLKIIKSSDVVHIHSGHFVLRFFHFAVAKILGKNVVVTFHSYTNRTVNFFDHTIARFSDKIVCVSEDISRKFNMSNPIVKEAFIPANLSNERELPASLIEWINARKKQGLKVCCANASRLKTYNDQDLYGLDLCVEAAQILKREYRVCFVFIISDPKDSVDIEKYRRVIERHQLNRVFVLFEGSISFLRLIALSDIILRPTNTDGDALTVREGLYLGKTVIASDVVERPIGTQLFENRSSLDLADQIIRCLENPRPHTGRNNAIIYKEKCFSFYLNELYQTK